jgi:DNA-binding beta-propeller fold protein YncE
MPLEIADPDWANVPPAVVAALPIGDQVQALAGTLPRIEAIAPTGTALLVTRQAKLAHLVVQVWDIARNGAPRLLDETLAPMHRASGSRAQKGKNPSPVEFAFTRDGDKVVQLSAKADDLKPSPIRILSPGTNVWREWLPANAGALEIAAAVRSTPGRLDGLVDFYNRNSSDESSRLIRTSELAVSPDGTRVARLGNNGATIRVLDRGTSDEVMSFPSGIDIKRFLAERKVDLPQYEPVYEIGDGSGALWSIDGKRLLINVRISSSHIWGRDGGATDPVGRTRPNADGILTRTTNNDTSTTDPWPGPHRVPPIHFNCFIILSAE